MQYSISMTILFVLFSLISQPTHAKQLVISVIDTGYTKRYGFEMPNFCKSGHQDFTTPYRNENVVPPDNNGHGTNIVHIIQDRLSFLPKNSYCIVVFKYWNKGVSDKQALINTALSFQASRKMKADLVNYSSFGQVFSIEEYNAVKEMLDDNIVLVAAAGNNSARIVSEEERYNGPRVRFIQNNVLMPEEKTVLAYPANYDSRIIVVGNLSEDRLRNPKSNWGDRIDAWEIGTNISAGGITMSGTSQATAVHASKIAIKMIQEKQNAIEKYSRRNY